MQSDDYLARDAIGLADLVRRGEASPRELIDIAIARAEAVNPAINAIVLKDYDAARKRASAWNGDAGAAGALAGVPYLIKDLGAPVAGLRMSLGSRHYRHYVPKEDAPIVTLSKAAGLNIFGKTNTPELGQMPFTEPELFGPCRNPWNLDHTPGGSSGGAAAAVAAGIVPMAHASDGGGSIRIPASCCGLFGLKPSRGRVTSATLPTPGELGVDHVISRSVRDSAYLLDLTSGNADRPPGAPGTFLGAVGLPGAPVESGKRLHIAFVADPMFAEALSSDARDAIDDAAQLAATLGHTIEPVSLGLDFPLLREAFLMLWSVVAEEFVLNAANISGQKPHRDEFEIATWAMAHIGRRLGRRGLADALEEQRRVTTTLTDLLNRYDVLLCATLAGAPLKIGERQPTQFERVQMRAVTAMPVEALMRKLLTEVSNKAFAWAGCTELFNLTGQPAMSVPLFWNARGLPIGVQFAAREGGEATLLALAAQLEQARPWFDKRPPLVRAR
ncbi:amidase [Paraburkholderia phosphatilytica]|uniref:amidase n=1 Tax=Paraburkholderia phosphatilytica TaxID=2282883 RepID=UPI000E47B011|nr:amidase family protein [Paraburkholderia phosphatilytica]